MRSARALNTPRRPQVVALQIPAEVVSLNRAKWCREDETATLDPTRSGVGRFIDQCGCGCDPAFTLMSLLRQQRRSVEVTKSYYATEPSGVHPESSRRTLRGNNQAPDRWYRASTLTAPCLLNGIRLSYVFVRMRFRV